MRYLRPIGSGLARGGKGFWGLMLTATGLFLVLFSTAGVRTSLTNYTGLGVNVAHADIPYSEGSYGDCGCSTGGSCASDSDGSDCF